MGQHLLAARVLLAGLGLQGQLSAYPPVDGRAAGVAVARAQLHRCALLDNHGVKCWREDGFGLLGTGGGLSRGASPRRMGDALPELQLF